MLITPKSAENNAGLFLCNNGAKQHAKKLHGIAFPMEVSTNSHAGAWKQEKEENT
jgi:hypothetical protein